VERAKNQIKLGKSTKFVKSNQNLNIRVNGSRYHFNVRLWNDIMINN